MVEGKSRDAQGLQELLAFLKDRRGFDFSGYKEPSLERRISRRMATVGFESYRDYIEHLEVNPDEFTDLFNTILINVTAFFRDKPAWDYLAEDAVPQLLEQVPDDEPLRVWSAGCSSGEEAYTVAIVLAEALGEERFRERVKIYATDVDDEALHTARQATYSRDALKPVPTELQEKYFERVPAGYSFRPELRRAVIFGRNDIVQDAPISRVDLLVSRNTLMYFTAETQGRILRNFNFALKETGFLFLGKSEMLITHTELFTPENLKWRVFRKVPRPGLRERLSFIGEGQRAEPGDTEHLAALRARALDVSPVGQVVVDRGGFVAVVNERARTMFGLGPADVGRPLQDLELSYRPTDLRSALQQAYDERGPVKLGPIAWTPRDGTRRRLEVAVMPIAGPDASVLGAQIAFEDVTSIFELDEERERSRRELEQAYEELQSTVEELETTNEELHSTNEELETTNEELQSTNEELETMNEELQSTNEELETMNDEQRLRSRELDRVNMFLEGILGSLHVGLVLLDTDRRVQVWNASSTELWGLRPDEVEGERFDELDIGLPVKELTEAIDSSLDRGRKSDDVVVDALTRRGRSIKCWVSVQPLSTAGGEVQGAILLMADQADAAQERLAG